MATGEQPGPCDCPAQHLLRLAWDSEIDGWLIAQPPNRRMRTRMYGGVTGKAGDRLPMSIVQVNADGAAGAGLLGAQEKRPETRELPAFVRQL